MTKKNFLSLVLVCGLLFTASESFAMRDEISQPNKFDAEMDQQGEAKFQDTVIARKAPNPGHAAAEKGEGAKAEEVAVKKPAK